MIAVIDGMGGGIGAEIVAQARKNLPVSIEIIALGTNALAADKMMRAGATKAASGENAVCYSIRNADYILGPIGIVFPNAMMGEITPRIAEAVFDARGKKLLIPLVQNHVTILGLEQKPLNELISLAIATIKNDMEK